MNYRDYYTTGKEKDKNSLQYKVKRYYEASAADYLLLWTNKKDLAMHFGYYDENHTNHRDAVENLNKVLTNIANIQENSKVIDAGCGYGNNSCWIAQKFNAQVLGLNIIPYQIKMAEDKAKAMELDHQVKFELRNFENTELESNQFDTFWALESAVHAENKDKLIAEAYRLLKPGGKIMICEYFLRSTPEVTQEEKDYLEPWLTSWAMPMLWTQEEYHQELEKVGFKNIHTTDLSKNMRPSLKRLKRLCQWTIPFSEINVRLGLISRDRYNSGKGSLVCGKSFLRGTWEYKVVVAEK